MLDFRLDRHDKNQLELKLNYGLKQDTKKQVYSVQAFVFVPRVLALTKSSYPPARFYEDTATFIRMTTPKIPLEELSSKSAVRPWASSVMAQVEGLTTGDEAGLKEAEQSLKLLGCIFKSAVRDSAFDHRRQLSKLLEGGESAEAAAVLEAFVENLRTALKRLRKVGKAVTTSTAPPELEDGWKAVDEYASLIAEEAITDLVAICKAKESPRLSEAMKTAQAMAIGEYQHRVNKGCSTFAIDGERNEQLPHRWRVLKRYVSSALYLSVARDRPGQLATDIIGMIAAAAAMLFATLAILAITQAYGASLSTAFLTGMVVAYVIKDRIKELGKRTLGRRLQRMMPDHVVRILGEGEEEMGTAKESFQVESPNQLPEDIYRERFADHTTQDAIDGRPETVLCYEKLISLSSEKLKKQFTGAIGLTDIIRLNLRPMMERMDDAWESYRYIHPKTGDIQVTRCAWVYHINVLIRLIAHDDENIVHRVRAIVNRKGIVRVESLHGDASSAPTTMSSAEEAAQIQIFDD